MRWSETVVWLFVTASATGCVTTTAGGDAPEWLRCHVRYVLAGGDWRHTQITASSLERDRTLAFGFAWFHAFHSDSVTFDSEKETWVLINFETFEPISPGMTFAKAWTHAAKRLIKENISVASGDDFKLLMKSSCGRSRCL